MAVKIRLARFGTRHRPYYRIVVSDGRSPRDGRFIEHVGSYDPMTDPPKVTLKHDRVTHWLGAGAKPSLTVAQLIRRAEGQGEIAKS